VKLGFRKRRTRAQQYAGLSHIFRSQLDYTLDRHSLAGPCRLVAGCDDLVTPNAGFARDRRLGVVPDSVAESLDVRQVDVIANWRYDLAGHLCAQVLRRVVLAIVIHQADAKRALRHLPDRLVAVDDTLGSLHHQRPARCLIRQGERRQHCCRCPALEPEHHLSSVLDRVVVHQPGGEAADLDHRAEVLLQKVHAVVAHVVERAATAQFGILTEGTLDWWVPAGQVCLPSDQSTQLVRFDHLLDHLMAGMEPHHEIDAKLDARAGASLNHLFTLGQRQGQWLLAEHVLASLGRGHDLPVVQVSGRGDVDGVDPVVAQHIIGIGGVELRVELLTDCLGSLSIDVLDAEQSRVFAGHDPFGDRSTSSDPTTTDHSPVYSHNGNTSDCQISVRFEFGLILAESKFRVKKMYMMTTFWTIARTFLRTVVGSNN